MSINMPSINPIQRSDTNINRRQPHGQPVRRPSGGHKPSPSKNSPGKPQDKPTVREA